MASSVLSGNHSAGVLSGSDISRIRVTRISPIVQLSIGRARVNSDFREQGRLQCRVGQCSDTGEWRWPNFPRLVPRIRSTAASLHGIRGPAARCRRQGARLSHRAGMMPSAVWKFAGNRVIRGPSMTRAFRRPALAPPRLDPPFGGQGPWECGVWPDAPGLG